MSKSQQPTGKGMDVIEITLSVVYDDEGCVEFRKAHKNEIVTPGTVAMEVHSHPDMCGNHTFKPNKAESGDEQAKEFFDFLLGSMKIPQVKAK